MKRLTKTEIVTLVIMLLITLFAIRKCDDTNKTKTELYETKTINSKIIKDYKDSISLYKNNIENIKENNIKSRDSIANVTSKAMIEKTLEIEKISNENKKLNNTYLKFDYAEEFYGLGKNIKNLVMTKSEFNHIVSIESKTKEYEKEIEEQKTIIESKNKEIKELTSSKESIEKENRILISKLDSAKSEKSTKEEITKFAKTYSITVDAKGLYGTEGLEYEVGAYVKKYLVNFEQDGVFISGGYKHANKTEHKGYVGVGVEF